jgi:hypothetical protein
MDASPSVVELSPKGGMVGQADKPFGKTLYGIAEAAKAVAKLADSTFTNFAQIKVEPNKTNYTMGALLSGMGTGKSAFLDRHVSLLREHCQNEALKELLRPESRPLVLNVTLNSGSDFLPNQGADSGDVIIARRMVYAYTKADWQFVRPAKAGGDACLQEVLGLIVDHHRRVCGMTDDQDMVVIVNVDELNQLHAKLPDKVTAADLRLNEVVSALRLLSMAGVAGTVGVRPTVLCLLAGTGYVAFHRALAGSGIEFIASSLPLLKSAEVMALMKECAVHEKYLSHPSFLQLLEDTGGVPRLLRKVLEGLTVEFTESCIAEARTNALHYVQRGHMTLSLEERAALVPFIVHGVYPPAMSSPLVKDSPTSRTFEDLRMTGAIFQEADQLVMPVLLLEALFPSKGIGIASLMNHLIYWYHVRTWSGFEMFGALFHALKMQQLSEQGKKEVSMEEFYPGAVMPPEVAAINITLQKRAEYVVSGQPTDIGTYQFPGTCEAKNKKRVDQLQRGAILLNGVRAPAGDCLIANPLGGVETGTLVRSLCVSHTVDHLTLGIPKIDDDHRKAKDAFDLNPELFGKDTKVVSVHLSNRALHAEAKTPREGCVVIGRDQVSKFFGFTFQRGLLSPTHGTALRVADSPRSPSRGYCTSSRAGGSRPFARPTPTPPLSACGTLLRNFARRLL